MAFASIPKCFPCPIWENKSKAIKEAKARIRILYLVVHAVGPVTGFKVAFIFFELCSVRLIASKIYALSDSMQ